LLAVAVLALLVAGIPAMVLMPVVIVAYRASVVPVTAEVISVILATSSQRQEPGQKQRRHHHDRLQTSHIKLLAWLYARISLA
jgi:hypothetical protein